MNNIKIVRKSNIDEKEILHIIEYFKSKKFNIVEEIEKADLLVSFGGDGTILSLITLLKKKNIPVFAINYGNVGYMTKVSKENIKISFEKFLKGEYILDHRNFIEIHFKNKKYYALNEISILKFAINSNLIEVSVYQEEKLINIYKADGIIIATPTGSTAYSLSANGPIIEPNLKVLCITPLAPQNLSARAIVLDGEKQLKFRAKGRNEFVGLNIDGNLHFKLKPEEEVFAKLSNVGIDLIEVNELNYFDVLKNKLNWS